MNTDDIKDRQVSAAYRDLASERAPAQLDGSVLRMAKAHAEHLPFSRWTSWSRPLAWAATVALCLAITLEVTQVTTPPDSAKESAPAEAAPAAATPAPDSDMGRSLDLQDSMADSIDSEKISPARSAAKSAAKHMANEALSETSPEARQEPVQIRAERSAAAAYDSAELAAPAAIAADMLDDDCSPEERAEPERWLECIAALEAGGDQKAARHQRELLVDTFPDFKLP